jgi:hypothetical protein
MTKAKAGSLRLPRWQLSVGRSDGRPFSHSRALLVCSVFLLAGLTFAGAAAAAPQPVLIGANVNVSRQNGNQLEAAVAIDPNNTQRVFVASNDETAALAGLATARSTDGGVNWTSQRVGTGPAGDGFPVACCDPSVSWDNFGNLFLAYLSISGAPRTSQVILLVSVDGGATFNNVAAVATFTEAPPPRRTLDQPTVTTGAGAVWVTYRDGALMISARGAQVTGLGVANIGAFNAAQAAPGSLGGNFGDIAIGPAGQVMVAYQAPVPGEGPSTIFVNLDADGFGAGAFGAAATVSATNVGGFDTIPAQPERQVDAEAGLAYDRSGGARNGRVYLVYTDEAPAESSDTDIFVRFSNDNGANWSAPVQVNDDTGTNSQFLPRISLDQSTGDLAITWHDARNDGPGDADGANNDAQYWGSFSMDGGATFVTNFQISAGASDEDGGEPPATCCADLDYGDYTGNDFAAGRMQAVWADNSNSTNDNPSGTLNRFDIYTSRVTPPLANRPPAVDAGPNQSGSEGSAISLNANVTDPDDPTVATVWTFAAGAGVDSGATCVFADPTIPTTTITCTDDGTYTATLTANDGFAPPVSDSMTVTVINVAPSVSIASPADGGVFQIGTPVSLSSSFTDPGANDTQACSINWDDGAVTSPLPVAGGCTEAHLFAGAGVYTITLTVTDDDGGSGSATVMVIVFDPKAGSVTGRGRIASPAGAYAADSTLPGRATFRLGAKYKKGATVPTGQTRFRFRAGHLKFRSVAYSWLVVTGAKAQYQGIGKVNGIGGFGFIVAATDGDISGGGGVDRFRIKIWEIASGNIVYDNAMGSPVDIDVANPQAIQKGRIVIHPK